MVNRPGCTDSDNNGFSGEESFRIVWETYTSLSAYRANCNDEDNSQVLDPSFNPPDGEADGNLPDDFKLSSSSPTFLKTGGDPSYASYVGAWEWPIDSNQIIGASSDRSASDTTEEGSTIGAPTFLRVVSSSN
jgi:hypothetical protein